MTLHNPDDGTPQRPRACGRCATSASGPVVYLDSPPGWRAHRVVFGHDPRPIDEPTEPRDEDQ